MNSLSPSPMNYGRLNPKSHPEPEPESTSNQQNNPNQKSKSKLKLLFTVAFILIVAAAVSVTLALTLRPKSSGGSGSAIHHKPTKAISRVCSRTLYQNLCVNSLVEFPGSLIASEKELVHISVNVTLQRVGKAYDTSTDINNLAMDTRVRSAYNDCLELLDDSVDQLQSSLMSVAPSALSESSASGAGSSDDIITWLSASLTNHDTCTEGLSEAEDGEVKNLLKDKLKDLSELVSNSLAIYSSANDDNEFGHTIKLDMGEDSFTCTLDRKKVTVDVNYLRKTLLLPEAPAPTKKFHPTPSEEVVLNFLLEIGFDIEPNKPLKSVSKVEAKLIPQPWRTIYYILARSISGRDCGHEHPRLPHLQIFWGIVNQKQIDYAQLIWDDIVFQIQRHYLKPFTKIPFVRYTKLLIYHLLDDNEDIPRRLEDPEKHLFAMDKTVNQVYMPKGSTHKQGMRLPDSLLTDKIKKTQTYLKYDKAFKEGYVGFSKYDDESTPAKLRKVSKAKKGKKTKDVPMDEDEEIDWDAATDEGMEHVIKENIERGEKERFSENKGGTSMTSLGNEERNSEDNEGMDDDDDDDDDDDRSYRWVRRNEKKQTPNPTPRKSTRTTSREPVVTVSVHEQPPTPEPTTQELDETSFVTVAQMKTVMSTAIAHVNEQIEKAVADQFKKYLASQPTTSQPTASSTQHPNTSGPQHNYKDFEFEELKQMMLAHMLDQPELRNAKPALFGYLYRGAEL